MVVGLGCSDTEPVKGMLVAAPGSSNLPPISARVDLAKLWPIVAKLTPATSSLADAVGQSGKFRADISPLADGIELRLNAEAGVLRLLGAIAAAQAAAAGAAQGFAPQGGPPAGLLPQSIQGFPIPPITPPGPPQPPAP